MSNTKKDKSFGQTPSLRITRLMALAIQFECLVRRGGLPAAPAAAAQARVRDYADPARLGYLPASQP
ncbi:MAG TPA: hypothetical protein EYH34_16030 [Planctomycetes bacterium]|nr:hypothetical protein [Planctomycetota bacterium]